MMPATAIPLRASATSIRVLGRLRVKYLVFITGHSYKLGCKGTKKRVKLLYIFLKMIAFAPK